MKIYVEKIVRTEFENYFDIVRHNPEIGFFCTKFQRSKHNRPTMNEFLLKLISLAKKYGLVFYDINIVFHSTIQLTYMKYAIRNRVEEYIMIINNLIVLFNIVHSNGKSIKIGRNGMLKVTAYIDQNGTIEDIFLYVNLSLSQKIINKICRNLL